MNTKTLWILSLGLSVCIACYIFSIWQTQTTNYEHAPTQLVSDKAVQEALASYNHDHKNLKSNQFNIPTGLFIQSFYFKDSSTINITGYIWQKYSKSIHDHLKRGFVFPEAVESGINPEPKIAYRKKYDNDEVIGWYFETTLRQNFDYSKYPFDHKQIWLRIWHANFNEDVVLVPDMKAYKKTGLTDKFGIEQDVVSGGWIVQESFFDYKLASYDTNFGIDNYVGQNNFPELHFNVMIQRKFLTAFIVNLLPLLVVIVLIFSVILSITKDNNKSHFGTSYTSIISALSGLFFIILLAHIQIRAEFSGNLVYMEYFYFVGYLTILIVAISSYYFYNGYNWKFLPLQYKDNLIIKLIFWPAVMSAALLCTLYHF